MTHLPCSLSYCSPVPVPISVPDSCRGEQPGSVRFRLVEESPYGPIFLSLEQAWSMDVTEPAGGPLGTTYRLSLHRVLDSEGLVPESSAFAMVQFPFGPDGTPPLPTDAWFVPASVLDRPAQEILLSSPEALRELLLYGTSERFDIRSLPRELEMEDPFPLGHPDDPEPIREKRTLRWEALHPRVREQFEQKLTELRAGGMTLSAEPLRARTYASTRPGLASVYSCWAYFEASHGPHSGTLHLEITWLRTEDIGRPLEDGPEGALQHAVKAEFTSGPWVDGSAPVDPETFRDGCP